MILLKASSVVACADLGFQATKYFWHVYRIFVMHLLVILNQLMMIGIGALN